MKEYDKVRIKKNNIMGIIIDIYKVNGKKIFLVEAIEKNVKAEGGYGGDFLIFDCTEDELEKIPESEQEREEPLFMVCDDTTYVGKEPLPIISEDVRRLMERVVEELNRN